MPCQYCKSIEHTLSQCGANIEMYWDPIRRLIEANPFSFRHQFLSLNAYPKTVLSLICSRIGLRTSLPKWTLIENIIVHYFTPRLQIDPVFLPLGMDVRAAVFHSYTSLQTWNIHDQPHVYSFQHNTLHLLEIYYRNAFGRDNLRELAEMRRLIISQAQPVVAQPVVAHPVVAHPVAFVSNKAHLKKLKIKAMIDKKLQVQECFMCCEEKINMRLGCSHEYCADCLVGTAKVRTKSFITCAVCRAEVAEVNVASKEQKAILLEQIKKE